MLLKTKIKGSGIAEVVIALAVISLCFMVASLVFVRVQTAPLRFQEIRMQTELQSDLFKALQNDDVTLNSPESEELIREEAAHSLTDSLVILRFLGQDQRVVWEQEWWNDQNPQSALK